MCRLALPHNFFGVHLVFHMSMLKSYHRDGDYIIKWHLIILDKDLQYEEEPIILLDCNICKLRTIDIKSVKVHGSIVQSRKPPGDREDMRDKYRQSFTDSSTTSLFP